jgi:hypothetical protein
MSDSANFLKTASDVDIERALRNTVADLFADDNLENLTVKRVRRSVEQKLHLPDEFLKTHSRWANKSKEIITSATDFQ